MAFDEATGKKLWEVANGRRFGNDRGDGPRGTPTVGIHVLYAYGASGDLSALDAATGKPVWKVNVLGEVRRVEHPVGPLESPLVLQDRVIVNAGGRGASVAALSRKDGSVLWKTGTTRPGIRRRSCTSMKARRRRSCSRRVAGSPLTRATATACGATTAPRIRPQTSRRRSRAQIFSSDYGTGAGLVELSSAGGEISAREVYFTREMRNHHASSVLIGDHLYGFSSAILTAMRFDNGQVAWRDRSVGKGSAVFADDRLYLFSEQGMVGLPRPTPSLPGTRSLPDSHRPPT